MAVKASGNPLAFSEIETEFGQNNDRDLGEYRVSQNVGGLSNQPLDTNIPQSGAIKFSDFYSKKLNVIIDYYSGSTENRPDDARTKYQAASASGNRTVIGFPATKDRIAGDSSGSKVRIHVNKAIGSATGNVNNCAVRTGSFETGTIVTVEVGSSGAIYGAGGNGGEHGSSAEDPHGKNGGGGTSALGIEYSGTTVINNGSIVAGGGGGGGGGYRRVEREEVGPGEVIATAGGGGGGGQGLPSGEGVDGGADGTTTAGGNGAVGGFSAVSENDTFVYGGGGGGGGSNGEGGEGGGNGAGNNDGGDGTTSKGGNGAQGKHAGSIEGNYNTQGNGGTGGNSGAAIRRTSGITVNIPSTSGITGATDATGVS